MTVGCSCGWRMNTLPGQHIEDLFLEHYKDTTHDHMSPNTNINSAA